MHMQIVLTCAVLWLPNFMQNLIVATPFINQVTKKLAILG